MLMGELPLRPGALRPVFGITSKAVVTLDVLLQWIQLAESVKADVLRVKKSVILPGEFRLLPPVPVTGPDGPEFPV